MIRLHEGLDYLIYKIYIFGGFALIAVYTVVLGSLDLPRTGNTVLILIMAPVTLWFLGILAYWWWVFLFKGIRDLRESLAQRPEGVPKIAVLRSKRKLHTALALYGGDIDNLLESEKAARGPVIVWFGMQNLLVLWVLGCFWIWIGFQEILPADFITRIMAPGVVVILALFIVATPILVIRAGRGGIAAYLNPLGLTTGEFPPSGMGLSDIFTDRIVKMFTGPAVYTGTRRERPVLIETEGKHSYTWVQSDSVSFEIQSQSGKLIPGDGAPEPVVSSLKQMRRAKRWRGVKVTGYPEGIGVERESPGENMWLYDLWLTERLLEALKVNV